MSSFPAQLRAAHTERLLRVATCVAASGHCGDLAPLLATARALYADTQLWTALARHRGPRGRTRLMHAALKDNVARARFLLERGAGASDADSAGTTALMLCASGSLPLARLLVEQGGADVNAANKDGATALLWARRMEVVQYLAERGASVNAVGRGGTTALMRASERGDLDTVRFLVEHGAEVNATDYIRKSALMLACESGHLDVVRYLVEGVANVNAESRVFYTPLIYACFSGHLDVVRFLVAEGGAAVNTACSDDGHTALTIAAGFEPEIAQFLVEAGGANVNAELTLCRSTALMLASEQGALELVKCLVEKGAKIDATDVRRDTALILACRRGHLKVAAHLVDEDANVCTANAKGETALYCACSEGHAEIVRLLLGRTFDCVDAAALSGTTPLMAASAIGRLDICALLTQSGADRALKNARGKTAYALAVEACSRELKPK